MIFLIFLIWLIFYGVKGFRLKNHSIGVIQAIVLFFGIITIVMSYNYFDNLFLKYGSCFYLLYSLIDYITSFQNISLPRLPYMSGIHIISKEVEIKYYIFKPLILFLINLVLIIKKIGTIKMSDDIEININSKNNEKINIKF